MKFLQLLCLLNFPLIYSKTNQIDNDSDESDYVHMLRDHPFSQNLKFANEKDAEAFDNLVKCGLFTVSSAGLIYYGPALLGFKKAGISKNSIMSYIQSFYGNVPKGSWFSSAQSFVYKSSGASLFSAGAYRMVLD